MIDKKVSNYLSSHRQEHLERLFELLGIPSIAAAEASVHPCATAAAWLAEHISKLGLQVELPGPSTHPYVFARNQPQSGRPTLLIYGHYDVQPPDPLELWESPPFEPQVRDGAIYARGADDDKGQLFAHLMAIEAWQRCGGLPVNVKLLLEGKEEIGSPGMEEFLAASAGKLAADAAIISDSEFFAKGLPSITYGLRGVSYLEITVRGPARDLHSGLHGGAVTNPVNALAAMIAAMHDSHGRVAIPGFYDGVIEPTPQEQAEWAKLPFDANEYAASLGVNALGGGERSLPLLDRLWARSTLECNGIIGGYTGKGSKTIIPSSAMAKITTRLVPGQQPEMIMDCFRRFLVDKTPPGVTAEITDLHVGAPAVLLSRSSPAMTAASAALEESFGQAPVFVRCGASVPVTEMFKRMLKLESVMMGLGLPEDNLHSPNEHFHLEQLWRGSLAAAAFMQNLAGPKA